MAVPRKPRRSGCQVHCEIWWGGDGIIVRGCAHCPVVFGRIDVSATYDEDLLRRQIRHSRKQHAEASPYRPNGPVGPCRRPIYSA